MRPVAPNAGNASKKPNLGAALFAAKTLNCQHLKRKHPTLFLLNLLTAGNSSKMILTTVPTDRNKFFDLSLSVNADYMVSEDTDFAVFKSLTFPKLNAIGLGVFLSLLEGR